MKREELEVLIGKYLDGTIEPIELELLLSEVRANEESGKLLARHSYHERTIADLLAVVPAHARTTRRYRRTTRRLSRRSPGDPASRVLLAAGSVLAAAVLLVIVYSASGERNEEPRRAAKAPAVEPPAVELPPPAPAPRSTAGPQEPGKSAPVEQPLIPNPLRKEGIPAPPVEASPVAPPPPAPRESAVAAAELDRLEGEVTIAGQPAKAGQPLPLGKRLEVVRGLARLRFPDGTVIDARGGTSIREITEDKGKRVHLDRGGIAAEVTRQPDARPMVFVTPHGECTVLGTTLRIFAGTGADGSTRVEVEKGKVRLTRTADKKTVEVMTGFFAVAAPTGELTTEPIPKPETLVQFEFEDGARPPSLSRFDGEVVRGPSNRFCVAGAERRDNQGNYGRYVRIQRDTGLVKFSEDLELRYDLWIAKQTSGLRIHMWNRTQEALLFATLPEVKEKQWVPIAIRVSDLRDGDIRFREGDVIGIIELVTNVDPRGGEGFFDNVQVVRLRR